MSPSCLTSAWLLPGKEWLNDSDSEAPTGLIMAYIARREAAFLSHDGSVSMRVNDERRVGKTKLEKRGSGNLSWLLERAVCSHCTDFHIQRLDSFDLISTILASNQ